MTAVEEIDLTECELRLPPPHGTKIRITKFAPGHLTSGNCSHLSSTSPLGYGIVLEGVEGPLIRVRSASSLALR